MCDFHWMLVLYSLRLKRGSTTWAVSVRWSQHFVYLLQSWNCPLGILSILHMWICMQRRKLRADGSVVTRNRGNQVAAIVTNVCGRILNDLKGVQIKGYFLPLDLRIHFLFSDNSGLDHNMIPLTFVLASNPHFLQLLPKIFSRKQMMLLAFCIGKKAADYSVKSGCQCVCASLHPPAFFSPLWVV